MIASRARTHSHPRSAGFTLLELIVVITIIGLLSTIVVVSTRNLPARGRRTRVDADLRNILTVANTINTETGRWPETIEEMVNTKTADGKTLSASLETLPKDPWGNEYRYEVIDGAPRVTCLGVDNAEGGEGEAEDVILPAPSNS